MKISYLREFLYLAEELNFTSTARHLYIAQSVLSKHIVLLEEQLNTALFVRDKHSVRLTKAGRLFYERAKKLLDDFDTILIELAREKEGVNNSLKVGYLHGACRSFLPATYTVFVENNPETSLDLMALELGEISAFANNNDIDLAITAHFNGNLTCKYNHRDLYRDKIVAAMSIKHYLANREEIQIEELVKEQLYLPDPIRMRHANDFVLNSLRGIGITNVDNVKIHDINSLFPILELNKGIAITFRHLESYYGEGIIFIPVKDLDPPINISAVWKHSKENESLISFVDILQRTSSSMRKKWGVPVDVE